jgi:hypothetical protein
MNAEVRYVSTLCSCMWMTTNDNLGVRHHTDPECHVHGRDAQLVDKGKLIREREIFCVAVREHRTEAITWIRRYRQSRKRLAELNAKLKELGE